MKINYPAVLVAAVVHFILGGLWYGFIFANTFVDIVGRAQLEQMAAQSHWSQYIVAFVTSLVLVYILAHFIQYTGAKTVAGGMQAAFWLWLGFVATTQLPTVIFDQLRLGLSLLSIGSQSVARLICGAIPAAWKTSNASDVVAEAT